MDTYVKALFALIVTLAALLTASALVAGIAFFVRTVI